MDRMIQMVIRMIMAQVMRKGVSAAMKAGGDAMSRHKARKGAQSDIVEQDPAIIERRERHSDERKGDEILYPTDGTTDDMQPRK
jgi:hypothetical protein